MIYLIVVGFSDLLLMLFTIRFVLIVYWTYKCLHIGQLFGCMVCLFIVFIWLGCLLGFVVY